jgi:hypothetical protein
MDSKKEKLSLLPLLSGLKKAIKGTARRETPAGQIEYFTNTITRSVFCSRNPMTLTTW